MMDGETRVVKGSVRKKNVFGGFERNAGRRFLYRVNKKRKNANKPLTFGEYGTIIMQT
jgi:hypothetical protein